MSRHATLVLIRLATVAALAGAGSLTGLSSSAAAPGPPEAVHAAAPAATRLLPGVSNCGDDRPVIRRRAFIIFCGDAGELAAKLHWTKLTPTTGTAVGLARANDCTPTCSAGHFHSFRALYVFSRVRMIDGAPAFTEVHITYTGRRTPYGHRHQADRLLDGSNPAAA